MDIAIDSNLDSRLSPCYTLPYCCLQWEPWKLMRARLLRFRGAELELGGPRRHATTYGRPPARSASSLRKAWCMSPVAGLDSNGYPLLHWASMQSQDLSAMERLLEFGTELEIQAGNGRTPFGFACETWGYFKAALTFLDQGAHVGVVWDGQAPIYAAALSMRQFCPHEGPPATVMWEDER